MLIFRKATMQDMPAMTEILNNAIALLKSRGIDQWQRGTPSPESLLGDVEAGIAYVAVDEAKVVAICTVSFEAEEPYRHIEDGEWLTAGENYAAVHRVAVAPGSYGKGYPAFLFAEAAKLAVAEGKDSLRIDTHPENLAMQKTVAKAGFTRCGLIHLIGGADDGEPRLGYEKCL